MSFDALHRLFPCSLLLLPVVCSSLLLESSIAFRKAENGFLSSICCATFPGDENYFKVLVFVLW